MRLDKKFYNVLSLYLIAAVFILSLPAQGWAMFVPSGQPSDRHSDLSAIQSTLESKVVKQRLMDYGLSSEDALVRINRLSDNEIHRIAANLDSLQAGADGVDALIFLLLVVIILVVVLQATGHHIVIRR